MAADGRKPLLCSGHPLETTRAAESRVERLVEDLYLRSYVARVGLRGDRCAAMAPPSERLTRRPRSGGLVARELA